jgi:hypothetical protein
MKIRANLLLACSLTCVFPVATFAQRCGKERWSVKTGTDSAAAQVTLSSAQPAAIADLIALSPPSPIPPDTRVGPTENTVFILNATLTDYKIESGATGDSDYHLVLMDDQGNTMVAEIPSPSCVDSSSPFANQIANARSEFDAQFTVTSSFQTANVPVQVTGVGFFDFAHGQHGAAPNVIELHPILDIQFNPAPAPNDFAITASTSAMHLHANSSSSVQLAATTVKAGNPLNIAYNVSGLPPGVTSQITPAADGKAKLILTASSSVPNGNYPVTVQGVQKGQVRSQTIHLNLSDAPEASEQEQWEYQLITATNEQDVITQANKLGVQDWELVGVARVGGSPAWRAFFKRLVRH